MAESYQGGEGMGRYRAGKDSLQLVGAGPWRPLQGILSHPESKWEPLAEFMEENSMIRIAFLINHFVMVWTIDWRQARQESAGGVMRLLLLSRRDMIRS